MNREFNFDALLVAAAMAMVVACGGREPDTPSPTTPTAQTTPDGQAPIDVESPRAGMNNSRPDSSEDVKPGTP